ncbi:unnamed protein product, partial [Amoebophrya sp. A25]
SSSSADSSSPPGNATNSGATAKANQVDQGLDINAHTKKKVEPVPSPSPVGASGGSSSCTAGKRLAEVNASIRDGTLEIFVKEQESSSTVEIAHA